MARIKREQIIDTITGEVLYAKTKTLRMFLFGDQGYMLFNNRKSIKMFPDVCWPEISTEEIGRIVTLSRYVDENNSIRLSAVEMAALLQISMNRVYVFLRRMIEIGVLARSGGALYICPLYLLSGRFVSYELYRIFKKQLDAVLPRWVRDEFSLRGAADHGGEN